MQDIKIVIKQNKKGQDQLEKAAQNFLLNVAENVRQEAIKLVPVDTGRLRADIDVYDGNDANEKFIGCKTVNYAIFIELGTVKMEAQPYLVPALENIISEVNRSK